MRKNINFKIRQFFTILIFSFAIFASCKKENQEIEKENRKLEFSLADRKLSMNLKRKGKISTFGIIKGSGNYEVKIKPENVVNVEIKDINKVIITAIGAGEAEVAILDKKWNSSKSINVSVAPLVALKLDKKEMTLEFNRKDKINIVSGNGDYGLSWSENNEGILSAELSENGKEISLTSFSKKKKLKLFVKDIDSEEIRTINISIIPPLIPHEKDVEPFKNKVEYSSKELLDLLKKTITMTKELLEKVNALPELPETGYNLQRQIYREGAGLVKSYLEEASKASEKDSKNVLFDKYYNLKIWGYCYVKIEWMARIAEQYNKRYPDSGINEFCKKFDGTYATQEGNIFITSLNRDMIGTYNKIIDIVNKIERK
ncbi:MAG: GAG-binding domain-containing protein [Candidatus Cryptobacteroides sp.]